MRVGEVTKSPHVLKAKDVHIAKNKDKILLILYSSKTHDTASTPQEIKISAAMNTGKLSNRFFCPFYLLRNYVQIRGDYKSDEEDFFILIDGSPVQHDMAWQMLKRMIHSLNLDASLYNFQSLHIGRATDLMKFGYNIETIKRLGCWRSNVVYKYLRPF